MRGTAKRIVDVVGAAVGLVVLSPLLVAIALACRVRQGRPVLYRSQRLGRDEVPFTVYKFRSMADDRDREGRLLPDADRLTPLGRRLRALSLDELPQLWNVLVGDMSLVGPRPLPVEYRHRFTAQERQRHRVRPGISGWAQVQGRNALDWDQRLAQDVWYVDHQNLTLDLRILARTVLAVLRRQGISAAGEDTMPVLRPELTAEHDDPR